MAYSYTYWPAAEDGTLTASSRQMGIMEFA